MGGIDGGAGGGPLSHQRYYLMEGRRVRLGTETRIPVEDLRGQTEMMVKERLESNGTCIRLDGVQSPVGPSPERRG